MSFDTKELGAIAGIPIDLRSLASRSPLGTDHFSDDDTYSDDSDHDEEDFDGSGESARAYSHCVEAMAALADASDLVAFAATRSYFNRWKQRTEDGSSSMWHGPIRHSSAAASATALEEASVARARNFCASVHRILGARASVLLLQCLQRWAVLPRPVPVAVAAVVQKSGKNVMAPIDWKALNASLRPNKHRPAKPVSKGGSETSAGASSPVASSLTQPPPPPCLRAHDRLDGRYLNRRSSELLARESFRRHSTREAFTRPPPLPPPPPPLLSSAAEPPAASPLGQTLNLADRARRKELLEADAQRLFQRQAHRHFEAADEEGSYAQVSLPRRNTTASQHGAPIGTRAVASYGPPGSDWPAVPDEAIRAAAAQRLSVSSTAALQLQRFKRDPAGQPLPSHLPLLSLLEGAKLSLHELLQPHALVVWHTR